MLANVEEMSRDQFAAHLRELATRERVRAAIGKYRELLARDDDDDEPNEITALLELSAASRDRINAIMRRVSSSGG